MQSTMDRIILNKWLGLPLFFIIIYALFWFTTQVGGSLQGIFSALLQTLCVEKPLYYLTLLNTPEWLKNLLAYGIGQGVQTTLSFVPTLTCMFFCLSFLEKTGYMSRAAKVMDSSMRKIGLSGHSFVPMVLGFGCNVPAILSAKELKNQKERILTILMTPFMSCGARLAIYALFVSAFFQENGQNIIFCLYLIGILFALATSSILGKNLNLKQDTTIPQETVLLPYQFPNLGFIARITFHRVQQFVVKAGILIIPLCAFIGTLGVLKTDSQETWLMVIGKKLTPIFEPMGIQQENWPATVGLLTGVLAKEVVVGTLSTLYSAENAAAARGEGDKQSRLTTATTTTAGAENSLNIMVNRFGTTESAMAYLLFVLLYFPCVSVLATIARSLSLSWALFSALWTTGIAYGVAVIFYQSAQLMHHPLRSGAWILGLTAGLWLGLKVLQRWVKQTMETMDKWPKVIPTQIVLS